jgi:hypothetical protein
VSRGEAKRKMYTAVMQASTTPPGGDGVVQARCSLAVTFTDSRGGCGACSARRPRRQGVVDSTPWRGSWSARARFSLNASPWCS